MTNELSAFTARIEEEEAAGRRDAIASIKQYDVERTNETTSRVAKDSAGVVLRNYFNTHPDEQELVDTEWNLRAFMQNGGATRLYEHPSVLKAENPRLYARVEELGLLRFDDEAVQKALSEGHLTHGDLAGYVHDGSRTPSLQVKKITR